MSRMNQMELITKLKGRIVPSRDHPASIIGIFYYPCGVILNDGKRNDAVFFVNKKEFLRTWGLIPKGEVTIDISEIQDIYESPYRLPQKFAQEVYSWGETGMGYYCFYVIMNDNKKFRYITGDAIDLIELPKEYSTKDIKAVKKAAYNNTEKGAYKNKKYYWCLVEDL